MIDPVDVPLDIDDVQESINSLSSIDPDLFADEIHTVLQKLAQGSLHPEAWRLVWRARLFERLDSRGLAVLDEHGASRDMTWRDVLHEHSGFIDSFVFELEIAAVLIAFDLDVAFVHGRGEANAPDLLIDDDLWVECKMRQLEPNARKWSRIKEQLLDEVVSPELPMENVIHAFTISFSDTLDQNDIAAIAATLVEMIEQDEETRQYEQYTITRSKQSISLSEVDETITVDQDFQTDPHGRNSKISVYADENGEITEFVGSEIQFDFEEEWYYPQKIRNRVKEALGKNLSQKEKSAVFIDVPPAYLNEMVARTTPVEHRAPDHKSREISQFERLDEEIRFRLLNQSSTLNIVCLYSSGIMNNITYCPLIRYWENEDCRLPDHDELIDVLTNIHRTYTGYLRAHELY